MSQPKLPQCLLQYTFGTCVAKVLDSHKQTKSKKKIKTKKVKHSIQHKK
jgi:hypothetical protein